MKKLWKAGVIFLTAALLCIGMAGAAFAKESDYDYDMDYYGETEWDGFYANFDKLDGAKKYDVNIARNGHHTATVTTTKRSVNMKQYFTRDGDYTFRVRGIRGSNVGDWGEWSDIQGYYEGQLEDPGSGGSGKSSGGGSHSTATGVWMENGGRWWFCFPDGTYPAGKWWQVDGKWYLFGSDGYMLTGWQQWNGQYYFLGADGAMLTNSWTPDGYYVGSDGVWQR